MYTLRSVGEFNTLLSVWVWAILQYLFKKKKKKATHFIALLPESEISARLGGAAL